jgi:hypothetical protein
MQKKCIKFLFVGEIKEVGAHHKEEHLDAKLK